MFYHYPASHSSRIVPSLLGLNNPLVCVFNPNADIPNNETSKGLTASRNDDENGLLGSYRGSNVYIEDTKDKYTISFDVPGVKIQDVKLQVKDSVLHVTAERKAGETTIAKFSQHFALDESLIDSDKLSARLTDGVLTISAPKKEEPAPQVISVTSSEPTDINEDGLVLTVDVPGIKSSDLKIEFHKGKLSINGERTKVNHHGKRQVVSKVNRHYHIKENQIDTSKIQAFLADGVLTVAAPPKAALPAKQIEIPTSAGQIENGPTEGSDTDKDKKEAEEVVVETVTNDDEQ
ncbi:hypothetical protein MPSEU_000885700 [Mayamaea pseudoterrestris]|nr:hypothetical protein MPSEU_000885700 [Mayamaea pseudoterrestris]